MISAQTRSSEDSKSFNVEQTHDRSGRLGEHTVAVQDDPEVYHEAETLNTNNETIRERIEEDVDFKIPQPPHSIVKQAQSASVRELIQKIENHPNRHALQQDLRQNQSFNPFSAGGMFIILGHWHRLLHVRALLAKRKRGKSEIHQVHDGPPLNSRLRH